MKNALLLSISLSANLLHAYNIDLVFKGQTPLPRSTQQAILETLNKECAFGISGGNLTEVKTQLVEQTPEAGSQLSVFVTELGSWYFYDGMHPSRQRIIIQSTVESDAHNQAIQQKVEILLGHCDESGR